MIFKSALVYLSSILFLSKWVRNYLSLLQKIDSKICITLFSHRITLLININENSLPESQHTQYKVR